MRWITFRQMYFSEPPSSQDWHLVLEVQFYVMLAISCLGESIEFLPFPQFFGLI